MLSSIRSAAWLLGVLFLLSMLSACGDSSGSGGDGSPAFTSSNTGYQDAGLISGDPPPPAPLSVIDPMDPWASLGTLSGSYRLVVYREEDDCSFGPDVPLAIHRTSAIAQGFSSSRTDFEIFEIDVVHRGDSLAFELGEGIVFAKWDAAASRLAGVERIGAEGITQYMDGFAVTTSDPATQSVRILGSSDWSFFDEYYAVGEQCSGRTFWDAERVGGPPSATPEDLQIVLRWPSSSPADLDLSIRPVGAAKPGSRSKQVDFVDSAIECYSLYSAGVAIPDPGGSRNDFPGIVAALDETVLPYHEEVIRCRSAEFGLWRFHVTNWSAIETVDFDLEVFWGPRVNTTRVGERSFGVFPGTVGPLARVHTDFRLVPPPLDDGGGGGGGNAGFEIIINLDPDYPPAERPYGPVTASFLEWSKAALEGYAYEDFLLELGL